MCGNENETEMKYAFVPIWGENVSKALAWVGPLENMAPEARKHLSAVDKQVILQRQDGKCSCCGARIQLYPFPNCDADHILGVARGGKTTLENMQLLCVCGHRSKTSHEARNCVKMVDIDFKLDAKELYIFTSGELQFPVDKRTPLEAVTHGCGLSLLSFERVSREYTEEMEDEVDFKAMLSKFAYRPSVETTAWYECQNKC